MVCLLLPHHLSQHQTQGGVKRVLSTCTLPGAECKTENSNDKDDGVSQSMELTCSGSQAVPRDLFLHHCAQWPGPSG